MKKHIDSSWMLKSSGLDNPKYRALIVLMVAAVAIIFYQITYYCALYIHDDIMNYCFAISGKTQAYAEAVATSQGRIMFYPLTYLAHLPFWANDLLIYKMISYASISFSALALGILVYRHVDKALGFVSVLLFFALAQVSNQHNLFCSYVLTHQVPIGILLLSFERQLEFYKTRRTRTMVVSALLLTLCSMLYEAFILFALLTFLIGVAIHISKKDKNVLRLFLDLKFHIVFMAAYLAVYFVWRVLHPSAYDGNVVSLISLSATLQALFTYSFGLSPLRTFLSLPPGTDYMRFFDIIFVVKGLLAAACLALVLRSVERFPLRRLLAICALCLVGMLLPNLLLSVTQRRVEWVLNNGISEYVTTFYSYFFLIIIITCLLGFLYTRIRFKKTFLAVAMAAVVSVSVMTDIANAWYAATQENQLRRMMAVTAAAEEGMFNDIEENSIIYLPDYVGIHLDMNNMSWFSVIYTLHVFTFTNKAEDLKFDVPTYIARFDADSHAFWFARIDADYRTDEITFVADEGFNNHDLLIPTDSPDSIAVLNDTETAEIAEAVEAADEAAAVRIDQPEIREIHVTGDNIHVDRVDVSLYADAA